MVNLFSTCFSKAFLARMIRSLLFCLLLLGVNRVAEAQAQPSPALIKYQFRDYSLDTLLLLRKQPGIPDTLRVFYLNRLSLAVSAKDLPAAVEYIREAIKLTHAAGYVRGELNCLKQLGNYYSQSGDYVQANRYYQAGVDLAPKHHSSLQLSHFYLNMGATAARTGDNDRSLKFLLLCLQGFKKAPAGSVDQKDSAVVFSNIANTYRQMNRWSLARSYAKKAVRLYQQLPAGAGLAESYLPDPALAGVLANTQDRIQSMALVHEYLYQSDNLVRMDTYLGELLAALHRALTSPVQSVRFTTEIEPMVMEPTQASALGVLISELITNFYKHAFVSKAEGHSHVAFLRTAKGFHLRVSDDGVGIVGSHFEESSHSLGNKIVKALAKQLKASLHIVPQIPNGVGVEVTSK